MTDILAIHPKNPQARLINHAVMLIRQGGVIVYPTDSGYALGCGFGDKSAIERICRIRQLAKDHFFTLLCRDLSEISTYAKIDNPVFRYLKSNTPGSFTFILNATKELPKRLHSKRKTIGMRVPANNLTLMLLEAFNQPLMNVSLHLPGLTHSLSDPMEIYEKLKGQVELIIDAGPCPVRETTVVDLTSGQPEIVREGSGKL